MFTDPADMPYLNYSPGKVILIFLISFVLLLAGCAPGGDRGVDIQPSATTQPTSISSPVLAKTSTAIPTETSIPATPTLGMGAQKISDRDGMTLMYVPAGEFTMGADYQHCGECGNDLPSYIDNQPLHAVALDAFWIDQTEVTNQQYKLCVADGKCALPLSLESPMRSSYYDDPKFDTHPVIYVEWSMARAYCEWAGRRLPTEAEWEKAARGTDARAYPWGNEPPNDNLLNFNSPVRDTTEVGRYPEGKSPYGVYDMAGNVWEWTSSLNWPYPYSAADGREDLSGKEARALRGGSWYYQEGSFISIFRFGVIPVDFLVRSDLRSFALPVYEDMSIHGRQRYGFGTVGFRCAMSETR